MPAFALFDDNLDADGGAWLLTGLREEVVADAGNWRAVLDRLEQAAIGGAWVALAADYELGYALEARLTRLLRDDGKPLLRAWIFGRAEWLDDAACTAWLDAQAGAVSDEQPDAASHALAGEAVDGLAPGGGPFAATLAAPDYLAQIARIQRYIRAGDCYQVNFTFTLKGHRRGHPAALYRALRAAQPVRYGAFIAHRDGAILSRSPELFLERRGRQLASEPMKGTAARSEDPALLAGSAKDRAENVMIVDLIRNDMGRLAPPGGVRVEALCRIDALPSVWQMSSRVVAEPVAADLADIFQALFPCGSITGAPKIRAMEIIAELEPSPRGLYCGALGWIKPGGDFRLAVAIRSVLLDADGGLSLGVGSGIVADSMPAAELAECHLKARFLTGLPAGLRLIETLRHAPGEAEPFPRLAYHLERLRDSAAAFGFAFDENAFRALLATVPGGEHDAGGKEALRVRITLGQDGALNLTTAPLADGAPGPSPSVRMAAPRVRSDDPLLRHKTTARGLYDRELARAIADGHFDALFENERGEVTEGARSNLFVARGTELLTPPLACGVLGGVLRRELLAAGRAREALLTVDDLTRAETLYVGNALRGLIAVRLAPG